MFLNKRQRWAVVTGVAGAVGAQVAEQLLTSSWRLAARKDPPADPLDENVSWRSAIIWTVAAASAVALMQLATRHGAAVAWKRVTGKKPPRPRKAVR
jgi:hypothetical protein